MLWVIVWPTYGSSHMYITGSLTLHKMQVYASFFVMQRYAPWKEF